MGEVFISYSHDSANHVKRVLDLSNKLRSEGIDCVLDQYESTPPEGWPRWMDKKIRDAEFVLMICTKVYYKRVMGEEEPGEGLGIRWEGNLIYQYIYNAGSLNLKFIPIIVVPEDRTYIPAPLQGATFYCINTDTAYNDLYLRLLNRPKVEKPLLGKKRALPSKEVKTDVAMFLSSPIDIELWNRAKWKAVLYMLYKDQPPVLCIVFENEEAAIKIFEGWRERYGNNDEYEELRLAIIEGDIPGEDPGYSVHIGPNLVNLMKHYKELGIDITEKYSLWATITRIHRMNPPRDSKNLEYFKDAYRHFKTYFLMPAVIDYKRGVKPLTHLRIRKGIIYFRSVDEIHDGDIDIVVIKPAGKWINEDINPSEGG